MANTNGYYNRSADYNPDEVADGDSIEAEFDAIQRGFDSVEEGKQPASLKLTALVSLPWSADKLPYVSSSSSMGLATLTPFARAILDDSDAATVRATIGAQVSDPTLTALSGVVVAKDQLIYATGADAFAVTPITPFARAILDDSDAATVRATIGAAASVGGGYLFRNKIVDGRFDFWYEGTSQTSSGYGSDTMWFNGNLGSSKTHSQQVLTPGVDLPAIDCPSAKYFSRTIVSSVVGAGNNVLKFTRIEDVGTLAGKTATLSFYAKADSSKSITAWLQQAFGYGGSAAIGVGGVKTFSVSNTWQRFSAQISIPSVVGKTIGAGSFLALVFVFDEGGGVSGTFDIACVQLEEGSVMTPFEELPIEISQIRLNRLFWKTGYIRRDIYASSISDDSFIDIKLPTTMRSTPVVSVTGLVTTLTGITYQTTNLDFIVVYATGGSAGGNYWLVSTLTADARL